MIRDRYAVTGVVCDRRCICLLMRPFDFSVPMTERCFLITPPEKWVNAAGRAFCDWLRA